LIFDRRALPLLLVLGCGDVHGLDVASQPLLVAQGRVDLAALTRTNPDVPLLAALIWAAIPRVSSVCLRYDTAAIRPACSDPYGVFLGEVEQTVPVGPDGTFTMPLAHLPNARVSVGDEVSRIAYATLLVFEDVVSDGMLDYPDPDFADVPEFTADHLVAATFYDLHAPQLRLVFREGSFDAGSNFYPAPGCPAPPAGFSLGTYSPYGAPPACDFRDATQMITVPPLAAADAAALECRTGSRRQGLREATTERRRPPGQTLCLSPTIMVNVPAGRCARLTGWLLVGCENDPYCQTPEFDHTADPPSWWHCP
jgi:hypothetical protein